MAGRSNKNGVLQKFGTCTIQRHPIIAAIGVDLIPQTIINGAIMLKKHHQVKDLSMEINGEARLHGTTKFISNHLLLIHGDIQINGRV